MTPKKEGTSLDPKVITVAGQEFISAGASSSDPDVWKTGLAFLDYRSFLSVGPSTEKFTPIPKENVHWDVRYNFSRPLKPNDEWQASTGREVPAENAMALEPIGSRSNEGKKVGPEYLLVENVSPGFKLDGLRIKNVIFKNTEITYEGGPVDMQNVYFVNCTFNVAKKPNGKNFATSVLASAPTTTFQAGG